MTTPTAYLSFLVRLWREQVPGRPQAEGGWWGEVEHIQNGQDWAFQGLEGVLDSLRRRAEAAARIHWAHGSDEDEWAMLAGPGNQHRGQRASPQKAGLPLSAKGRGVR